MIRPLFLSLLNRLWIKLMIPISMIIVCLVMVSLVKTIGFQEKMGRVQLEAQSQRIIQAVEGPMFDSLAIGDNDSVRKEFVRMSEKLKGLELYVYDFNGTISFSFSTDINTVGTRISGFINPEAGRDIEGQLETGENSGRSFLMQMDDQPFRVTSSPILNMNRCYHCHGTAHKVIGGITVLSSAASIQNAVNQGKKQSIIVGGTGLVVAQEISDLADETGNSATQANEKVQGIKDFSAQILQKISNLSESVDESGQAIAGISAAVEQQNAATGEIIKSMTLITEEILDVNNNIGQSALATEEITKELAVTQEGAQDVQADSLKLTKNAGVLSDLAQNFMDIIRVFKV